ncbi:MAG: ATP-binding cassette domain-containing protein [Bacteroidota bacterium]
MIEIHNLHKAFEGQIVLNGINLTIPDGSRLGIIGGSGSGKSVLLRCILGLESPEAGEIYIDGQKTQLMDRHQWRAVLDQFGVVFQRSALFDSLSVGQNVGIKLYEAHELSPAKIEALVLEALAKVQLGPEVMQKFPEELSGGMQKRVAIARAIIHQPRYLVYDEPSTGLDPISADRIDELILDLAAEEGRTSIIVTHDMDSLHKIANQVAMVNEKKIGFAGKPEDFWQSARPEIKAFLRRSG